ncbi:MAG: hypothetical protein KAS64_03795 [Spirochaetes bacterium]|nr:hypothetical protein [Spirochaetota bacterium]
MKKLVSILVILSLITMIGACKSESDTSKAGDLSKVVEQQKAMLNIMKSIKTLDDLKASKQKLIDASLASVKTLVAILEKGVTLDKDGRLALMMKFKNLKKDDRSFKTQRKAIEMKLLTIDGAQPILDEIKKEIKSQTKVYGMKMFGLIMKLAKDLK